MPREIVRPGVLCIRGAWRLLSGLWRKAKRRKRKTVMPREIVRPGVLCIRGV